MSNLSITFIYTIILVITYFITKKRYKTILKLNFLYTVLWCFCGVTSIYNRLHLLKPRLSIHIMIIISIILFNIIYLSRVRKNIKTNFSHVDLDNKINKKIVYLANFLAILFMAIHFFTAIKLVVSNGFDLRLIRNEVYVSITENSNNYEQVITRVIPTVVFSVVSLIAAVYLVLGKRNYLYLALIDIFIGTITFGGRNFILNFILYYVSACIILNTKMKIKIKKRYIVIGILVLWITTSIRTGSMLGFMDNIILYLSGSLSFLEYILRSPIEYGLNDGLMYGYMTFAFILEPIILILKSIFGISTKVPSYYFNNYVQDFVNISETDISLYNNNTTMFFNFIKDFGIYGVSISIIFLATFIVNMEKRFYNKNSIRSLFYLIYLYTIVFTSSISYKLNGISSSLVFILLWIITLKKKPKNFSDKYTT